MKTKITQWVAIILLLESAVLHFVDAQGQYDKVPYLGYLFMLDVLGMLIAAFGIYHNQKWGWAIGLVVSLGSIAIFVASRTLGLPDLPVQPWRYPYGLVTLAVEGLFIIICLVRPWSIPTPGLASSLTSGWARVFMPVLALTLIGITTFSTYKWDGYARQVGYHEHVGSLDAVCSTPITSLEAFEQEYGLKITLIAVSAMDSIVDVRLKVTDAEKAQRLLTNQSALLVDEEVLVLAPHIHRHRSIQTGKLFLMFFSTQNNTIRPGSQVSLVFGRIRVAPITVQ